MEKMDQFDVIIIGGSYAGLSAAMALGRSLRQALIIDSGDPCNKSTPRSPNLLTQDGKPPLELATLARPELGHYPSVRSQHGFVARAHGDSGAFQAETATA